MSHQLTPDGTAYELHGSQDAPLIALIHGLGLSRHLWADYLVALSQDFRVLTYDLYGHGDSEPSSEPSSLAVYSDQLSKLLNHVDVEQAHVVGFSIGGMINRRFALDHSDQLASLVIMNSPHDRGKMAQDQVEQRAMTVRNQGAMATMESALQRWFTPTYLNNGKGVQQVKDWRLKVDGESYVQAAWVLANGVRELIDPEPSITAPSLVITCENDSGSTPAMSVEIAGEIKGADLLIIPNLQHLGLIEDPNQFTRAILKFLKED